MKLSTKESIDLFFGKVLVFFNAFAARLLGFLLRRDHGIDKDPDCIIFIKMLGLGSILMAADAILAIRNKYPKASIVLICSNSIQKETSELGLFDEIWAINDSSFSKIITSSFRTLLASWKRKNKWTVNLEVYSRLSTIFALWTFARNRFGFYFNEVQFRYVLNTHHVYFNAMTLAYHNYEQMAKALNADVTETYTIPVAQKNTESSTQKKYIAINNNCSELAKERVLPAATLEKIISDLLRKYDHDIVLIGSKVDFNANERILQSPSLDSYKGRIVNIAGKYAFLDFLSFLKYECVLMISVDSGPVHFAYRLNMPLVSIWGPTNPQTRIPDSFKHEVIYLEAPCSPCVHHTNVLPCGGDNFCMKNIQASQILVAVNKYIPL